MRKIISSLLALALCLSLLSLSPPPASAGINTILTLNAPSSAPKGETVTFTGRLTRADTGAGIAYVTIRVYDSDTWPDSDDLLASGTTNANGYYSITWVAESADWWDSTTEAVAKFDGIDSFNSSMSSVYTINITEKPGTTLSLSASPTSQNEGQTVTFTGRLTRNDTGAGVAGAEIKIWDSDLIGDDLLVSSTTNSSGYYSITWTAARSSDDFDDTVEAFAKYEGSATLNSSQSDQRVITILTKIGTTLTLSASPTSQNEGQIVAFTGRLTRNDTVAGVSGATVTIYDSDLIGDDLLVSGTTDSGGYYSITWTAEPMDIGDKEVESYAKYEGSEILTSSQSVIHTIVVVGKVETTLTLDTRPATVTEGDAVVFTGRLIRSDTGEGITGCKIWLYDSDSWPDSDDLLASGTTDAYGYYSMTWIAGTTDVWDSTVEIIVKFYGTAQFNPSESSKHTVTITEKPVVLDNFGINSLEKVLGSLDFGTGIKFTDFAFRFAQTPEGGKELYFQESKLGFAEVAAKWNSEGQLIYWSAAGEAEGTIISGFYPIVAFAGPVPVVITVDYKILAGIEFSGNNQIGKAGDVEIKPYLKGIVQAHLYGIFGPEGTIEPYLRIKYYIENNSWSVFAGVEAQLKLELDIFGYYEYTVWDTDANYEVQLYP